MTDTSSFTQLGVITGAHGIRGQVKVKSYTESIADLTAYGPLCDESGTQHYDLTITGIAKNQLIAKIDGITDRNQAESLKGTGLFVSRDALPAPSEDEYYHIDLLNLSVITEDGEPYGTVKAMHNFGAGDVMEILTLSGKTESYSFVKQSFPSVDLSKGTVTFSPPDVVYASLKEDDEPQE